MKQAAMQYDIFSYERFIKFAVHFMREAMSKAVGK